MFAKSADPRYTNVHEFQPVYRVDFWDDEGSSDEWRLTDVADVCEVFEWARRQADGRTASVCVEYTHAHDGGTTVVLLRLSGPDPV